MRDLPTSNPSAPSHCPAPGRSRRLRSVVAFAGMAMAAGVMSGMSPPEPDPIPRRWQLEVEVGDLRVATFDVKDEGRKAYFYMTYKVTNNSGEDLLFAPSFELAMDHQVLRSGRQIPLDVTKQLLESTKINQIEDQISIIGQLLQGKENAKHGLVVWPASELSTLDLTLYAAGFSGETATVERPDNKDKVVLRKSLMVRYASPGDLTQNGQNAIPPAEPSRWIMR
jgi:hypothetical protein